MNTKDEHAMHILALRLADLTKDSGWNTMQYLAIGQCMDALSKYCQPDLPSRLSDDDIERMASVIARLMKPLSSTR